MDKQIDSALRDKIYEADNIMLLTALVEVESELEGLRSSSSVTKKLLHFKRASALFLSVKEYLESLGILSNATSAHIADTTYSYPNYVLAGVNNFIFKMNTEVDKLALQFEAEIASETDDIILIDLHGDRGTFQDTLLKWVAYPNHPFKNGTFKSKMSEKGYTLDKLYTHEKPNLTTSLYEFQYENVLGELQKLPDVQLKVFQSELRQWLELESVTLELTKLLTEWHFFEGYTLETAVKRGKLLLNKYYDTLTSLSNSKCYMNSCVDLGYSFADNKNFLFNVKGLQVKNNVLLDINNSVTDFHKRIYADFKALSEYVKTMYPVHFYAMDTAVLDVEDIDDEDEIILSNYAMYVFQTLVEAHSKFKNASKDNPMRDFLGVYLLKYTLEDITLFSSDESVFDVLNSNVVTELPNGVIMGYLYVLCVAYDVLTVRNGEGVV